jgi:hypothetical protein
MLTQLDTVKTRLALLDTSYDVILEQAIIAISARFDQETNRSLARTENAVYEFPVGVTEIAVPCYPVEAVTRFEFKASEAEGWVEQPEVEHLVRRGCIICVTSGFILPPTALIGRVTYAGGYLLPGAEPVPGANPLPADLEQAAVEQTAFWFQTRDLLGVIRQWPKGGNYVQFADPDLLPAVRRILERYTRWG